jgi:6-phosphogluconolactonase
MGLNARIEVAGGLTRWIDAAVERFVHEAESALDERGAFRVSLAGGNTPKQVYEAMARDARVQGLDWSKIWIFFGDERCVPPEDPSSNAGMAAGALLDSLPIPRDQVVRMLGELPPFEAAARHEAHLAQLLGGSPGRGGAPETPLDLALLGLGGNGHTASLFPGLTWSVLPDRWVLAEYVEVMESWRVTMTPLVLNAARQTVFLVEGAAKRDVVARVLEGPRDPVVLPSQGIVGATWLLDEAAAAGLHAP